jgi:hypothetical protein
VRYECLKINRCSEDNFRIGKHGTTWDNGNTRDNATWDSFKLKCSSSLRFLKKKFHDFLFTTSFYMNESFPCSLWLHKKLELKVVKYG